MARVKTATLFSYFTSSAKCLPNPSGPLSAEVPSSSIKSANKIVGPLLQSADPATCKKRGQYRYDVFTPGEKASIAQVAGKAISGVWLPCHAFSRNYENTATYGIRSARRLLHMHTHTNTLVWK